MENVALNRSNGENLELLERPKGNGYKTVDEVDTSLYFTRYPNKRIDYVLAYAGSDEETGKGDRETFLANLESAGLQIEDTTFKRNGSQIHIWKLHAPFHVLLAAAEDMKLKKETSPVNFPGESLLKRRLFGVVNWFQERDPFVIQNPACKEDPIHFVAVFDKDLLADFRNHDNEELFFTHTERSRMVYYKCSNTLPYLETMLNYEVFTDAYPLHQGPLKCEKKDIPRNARQNLQHDWASWSRIMQHQPRQAIRDYFGEKIGFYFAWLGFYTLFLIPAALVGLICFLYGVLSTFNFVPAQEICEPKDEKSLYHCPLCDKYCSFFLLSKTSCLYAKVSHFFDNEATVFFSLFMSLWATFFLEFWKRKQASLAYEWHTSAYEQDEEKPRPQYSRRATMMRKDLVTFKYEPFIPLRVRLPRIMAAMAVVIFFVTLVLGSLLGVIVYRAVIYSALLSAPQKVVHNNAKIVVSGTAALINLLVIFILRFAYCKLAKTLTGWENPRTLTDYENSFTMKMFWFQFVNTYSSVFYVAFFKRDAFVGRPGNFKRLGSHRLRLEGCSTEGCFLELCVQVFVIMIGQQLLGTIEQVLLPRLRRWYIRRSVKTRYKDLPQWEKDYDMEPREELSLFWEYLEIVLQYGFITMFVAAFPLAPLLALINNVIEIRIDGINFIENYRRPVPLRAENIGIWYVILATLTEASVLVNALVIAFTSDFIPRLVYQNLYSPDGSLHGYVNNSLSYFKVADFSNQSRPENPTANVPYSLEYCRYPGYYKSEAPYHPSSQYYLILSVRLGFVFLFQWAVTVATRILAWYIPDVPGSLQVRIKRENFLANEAIRNFKIEERRRKQNLRNNLVSTDCCDTLSR